MPNLETCGVKCFDTANPGVEDAKFEMNLPLPSVSDHIAMVKAAMLAPSSELKTTFFADKKLAPSLSALVDAKIMNAGAASKLVKGSVVTLTAAQYNELMYVTKGDLPTGLVYNVDCRDRGNGPATTITIGGSRSIKVGDHRLTVQKTRSVNVGVMRFDLTGDVPRLTYTLHDILGEAVWDPLVLTPADLRNGVRSWDRKADPVELERLERFKDGKGRHGDFSEI